MSDVEERPSKIRKLEVSGGLEDTIAPLNPTKETDETIVLESEDNPLAGIAVPLQSDGTPPLSKSQLKKLKKRDDWEAGKEWRKAKKKELLKAKQARKAEARQELQQKIANGEIEALPQAELKKTAGKRPVQVPVTFILDCDFDEYMMEKEIISLGAQVTRCYSDNKTSPYRANLVVSSWGGRLKERFDGVLTGNHTGWKGVKFQEIDFVQAAAEMDEYMRSKSGGKLVGALAGEGEGTSETKLVDEPGSEILENTTTVVAEENSPVIVEEPTLSHSGEVRETSVVDHAPETENLATDAESSKSEPNIIYLTSDSPYTLDRLNPNTSYIIGGIVDKNRHKGLCYKRAREHGIATAKLPIGEYLTMASRSVLAVNHVVEIMLKWLETGDWGDAFLAVIPKRKEAKLKARRGSVEEESEFDDYEGGVNVEKEDEPEVAVADSTALHETNPALKENGGTPSLDTPGDVEMGD